MVDALFLKNSKGITNKMPQLWSPPMEKWEKRSLFWPYCGDETTIAYDRASEYSFSFPKKRLLSVLNMFIFIELCPQERTGKRSVVPWLMQGKASCSQENTFDYGAKGSLSFFGRCYGLSCRDELPLWHIRTRAKVRFIPLSLNGKKTKWRNVPVKLTFAWCARVRIVIALGCVAICI